MISVNCEFCGNEFEVKEKYYEKYLNGINKHIFCSRKCTSRFYANERKNKLINNKVCEMCGKEYHVSQYLEEKSRYCSLECYNKERETHNVLAVCDFCGETFKRIKTQIDRFKNNFCSKKCKQEFESMTRKQEKEKWGYKRIECTCVICGRSVLRTPYEINRMTNTFCSIECKNIWMKEIYPKTEEGRKHYIQNGLNTISKQKFKDTLPERLVEEYLINNNITYFKQHKMYNKFVVDFYIVDTNDIIEVQGDYWHGNPLYYGEGKIPLSERQIKQINRDKSRYAYLTKSGHNVFMVWETDIYNNIDNALSFVG